MAINVKPNTASRAKTRVLGIILALASVAVICIVTAIASAESRKTISVVRVKTDSPIGAGKMITERDIEKYEMYYKEFAQYGTMTFSDGTRRSTIVTWDNKDYVVNTRYASYYLRGGTVLFWDATTKEQSKKNSYLYSMDGELLNIQLNVDDFGDMVVPGDTLNIRAMYEETEYNLPTEEAYQLSVDLGGTVTPVTTTKLEKLFSGVSVLDMLNSDGASIFDIYYSYIGMTKAEQQAALQSDDFLESVKPVTVLLEVTSEEADHFATISKKNPTYLVTLLPRTGSNSIIDSLSDIQSALSGVSSITATQQQTN